nr:sorbitol dehydrogenase [Tanacetum cinerariifolium]
FGNCHEAASQASAAGGFFGYSHITGGYDGGQAEYVRVPYANVSPTVIPPGMDIEDAVLLTDVVPTGYQAAEMGGIQTGDTVVVFGAGPVVLFIKKQTDWIGADVCIDAVGAEAAGNALQTITGRKTLLQAGSATAVHWAINSVRKGGVVSIVGVY